MKEIKFKAFANGYMFEVTDILWHNGKISYIRGVSPDGRSFGGHKDYMDINEIKLMQFTGLHDRTGKEIYEGDIVATSKSPYAVPGVVRFGEGIRTWSDRDNDYDLKYVGWCLDGLCDCEDLFFDGKMEVIGNIHENPEQLEEK